MRGNPRIGTDEVIVERVRYGRPSKSLIDPDTAEEIVRHMTAHGYSIAAIAERMNFNRRSVSRIRSRLGITPGKVLFHGDRSKSRP